MIINNAVNYRMDKHKHKQEYMTLNPESEHSSLKSPLQYNYQDIKRPLRQNPQDLSFKGLSLRYKDLEKVYSKTEFFKFVDKYIGQMGHDIFDDITVKHAADVSNLIKVDGDNIKIAKKTIPHLALDGMLYPFKILPGDMLNGAVELLGKLPGLGKWSEKTLERPLFKNIRQRSKIESKVNSLIGLITYKDTQLKSAKEAAAKRLGKSVKDLTEKELADIAQDVESKLGSKVFQSSLKMFDPQSGNYDTKHERALNRLVSGLPPAIFLANDAYNLSRMMDDDPKAAEHERKVRFKQETSRILTSGYLTLITMGAFQKFINKSKFGIVLTTGTTVLITEMFSRLSNGKHITRLTPEQARAENERNHAPEAKIKPQKEISSTGNENNQTAKLQKEQQKPLLSFDTVMKASAVILGLGYGIKGFKNLPAVRNMALKYFDNMKINNPEKFEKLGIDKLFDKLNNNLKGMDVKKYGNLSDKELRLKNAVQVFEEKVLYKPFTDFYKKITSEPFHVDKEVFDNVIKVLEKEPNFEKLAQKYKEVGHSAVIKKGGKEFIDLGSRDKEIEIIPNSKIPPIKIKPLVNFIIAPFKFMWNTVTLPYWMVDEKLMNVFRKTAPKAGSKDIDALAKSFDKICKQALKKNLNKEQFKDYVQVNLLKAFNVDSLSSVSNAELSNLAKTAASVATIWFLMTDNYNMVMLKSNGNDKDGANTKFKERFVQEGSRLFYQTLLIDLFNSTFRNQYNSSLLGMSWITLANTTLGEMLTRSSVGTPIKAHTRDELIEIETIQNNSTGFKKKYYNFMQRLTGKRSIKSYEVAPRKSNSTNSTQVSIPSIDTGKHIIFKQDDKAVFNNFTSKIKG